MSEKKQSAKPPDRQQQLVDPKNNNSCEKTPKSQQMFNSSLVRMAESTPEERTFRPFFGVGEIEYTPPCENCHHAYPNVASSTSAFFNIQNIVRPPDHYPFCSSFEATQSMPPSSPVHWPHDDSYRR